MVGVTKNRDLSPGDRLPADYTDALGEFLGASVHNFLLQLKPGDSTSLQVPAAADNGQVGIAINGRWRYNTAAVNRASPGGSARTMDVFVTASDNVFVAGGGGEIDNTVYSFGLSIVNSGTTPSGVALCRKVGTAVWDGAKFTSVTQTAPPVPTDPRIVDSTWSSFTPTVHTLGDADADAGTSSLVGAYKITAGVCFFTIVLLCDGTFDGGTGGITFALPAPAVAVEQVVGSLRLTTPDGVRWQGLGFIGAAAPDVIQAFAPVVTALGVATGEIDHLQNASDTAHLLPAGATAVPARSGIYPLSNGAELVMSGHYHVAG